MATDPLLAELRLLTGCADAEFRAGQREAVELLVEDRARVLVVQRTGWGKSAVYFLATRLLRALGLGPTLLISPLLALMRSQIDAAGRLGLRCATVNSAAPTTVTQLHDELRADAVDLLLVSPERLANPEFADRIMPLVGARPGLIVIDEVHCISDWGHDFRPDYRRVGRLVDGVIRTGAPVLGCTATANDRVVGDVAAQLGTELTTVRGPLVRRGLSLCAVRLDRQAERLAWLAQTMPQFEGTGIIYCLTVRDVENVAGWLTSRGRDVLPYHADLDHGARLVAEQRLLDNEVDALVATVALGMGYDKPDVAFVVHFQSPGSPVAYYQQVGRAGRALARSRAVLLRGLEDGAIQDHFIERAFADEHAVRAVLDVFDRADGPLSLRQVQRDVDVRWTTLEQIAKQLDVDGALRRTSGQVYERTLRPWTYPAARVQAVTEARRAEQRAMSEYLTTSSCRMRFLSRQLDDPSDEPCGECDNCTGASDHVALPADLVADAEEFLRSRPLVIEARRRRDDPIVGSSVAIPAPERLAPGRALSSWGDAGWGRLVRNGKQRDGHFDDRLVEALVALVGDWRPDPRPEWVTAVPSLRHPNLVASLAVRVAAGLGLPYHDVVETTIERPPQKAQQSSVHQHRNVAGAFTLRGTVPFGPVLLIDDVVDSRWTVTEVGRVLRRAGVTTVHPVALASSAGRG